MPLKADMLNLKTHVLDSAMKQKVARPGPFILTPGHATLKHLPIVQVQTRSGSGKPEIVIHLKVRNFQVPDLPLHIY